jgi:thymidylate synthase (FAD)
MNLVQPSAILESITPDSLRHIERCGRTAYKSEDKITDVSAPAFVKMIIKRGHESVLEHASATIRFICDRGVSHELVRHRLCAFTQESTRYCDYAGDVTIIEPHNNHGVSLFVGQEDKRNIWITSIEESIRWYKLLRELGVSPQHARAVLPNCLKTEIVVTANFREWRHIFGLRLSEAAHPAMRYVMSLALKELVKEVPVVFDSYIEVI